jgi:LPPG:FO 2-phospho-L-lactate transferase
VAVSPIIAGQAVKGPAAKMYRELGMEPSAHAVAAHYGSKRDGGLLSGFIMDLKDSSQVPALAALGMGVGTTETLMFDAPARRYLAEYVLGFVKDFLPAHEHERS